MSGPGQAWHDGVRRRDILPPGAVLKGYILDAVLGQGGFGIVYRPRHPELGNVVAIEEYSPTELALRESGSVHSRNADCRTPFQDGLRRFLDEAKRLAEFPDHPNIVSCRDFLHANETAYVVMTDEHGPPLPRSCASAKKTVVRSMKRMFRPS